MTGWIQTDNYQWLRKVGDHEYEMYQIMKAPEYVEREYWFAGGGEFKLEWYEDSIDYCINDFGYESVDEIKRIYGDHWERIVAECVFECNWADYNIESFDTLEEAQEHVGRLMRGQYYIDIYGLRNEEWPMIGIHYEDTLDDARKYLSDDNLRDVVAGIHGYDRVRFTLWNLDDTISAEYVLED